MVLTNHATQQSVHWTGGYAARFQAFSLAQSSSVKMSLPCPSRQPVTQAVSPPIRIITMLSNFKNWATSSEFWLAIITGLTLSIGLAPAVYLIYFLNVEWTSYSMTHPGPLAMTSFGYQLCWINTTSLFAFPIITFFLARNYRKMKQNYFSRLWFVLPFVQFIWGLINMVFLFALLG